MRRAVILSDMVSRKAQLNGYLVHIYTASTLVFVALAFQWLLEGRYIWVLWAFAVMILIDATDGALARRYRVKETAAAIDGSLLDNIVDFLSYVVLPMVFMLRAEMLLTPMTMYVALTMFASAFGFSRTTSKLAGDGFFVGFPSYWNIVVFYLYLLGTPPLLNTLLIVSLSLLVFVPVRFLYVSRLPEGRGLHLILGGLWGLACLAVLLMPPSELRRIILLASLVYPCYYTVHSLVRDLRLRLANRALT